MRHILLAATALVLVSGGAFAQSSTSGSSSTAVNSSGSKSTSVSNPRVNVIGNPIGNGASSSVSGARSSANSHSSSRSAAVGNSTTVNVDSYAGVGGSGSNGSTAGGAGDPQYGVNYSGSYTVRNTPEVIPPSIVGGNACAVGASAGMSMAGFGIAGGATWADAQCERRQQAALLYNMGEQKVALELMCQDDHVRAAMKISGKPCTVDVPVAAAAPAPVAQAATPIAPTAAPRVMPVVTTVAAKPARPEWCYTASPAEQRAHPACSVKS